MSPNLADFLGVIVTYTGNPKIGDMLFRDESGNFNIVNPPTSPTGQEVIHINPITGHPEWVNLTWGGGGGGASGLPVTTIATVAANQALTLSSSGGGAFNITLTQNTVLGAPSGAAAGTECLVDVELAQDATGGRSVAWWAGITWLAGRPPTIPTAPTASILVSFVSLDGGSTWFGSYATGAESWRKDIDLALGYTVQQGTWGLGLSTSRYKGSDWENGSTHALNDQISYDLDMSAGTWTLSAIGVLNADSGIISFLIDGTVVGTWDQYSASLNNLATMTPITGIAVSGSGKHTFSMKMASKNASSTAYSGRVSALALVRTA